MTVDGYSIATMPYRIDEEVWGAVLKKTKGALWWKTETFVEVRCRSFGTYWYTEGGEEMSVGVRSMLENAKESTGLFSR